MLDLTAVTQLSEIRRTCCGILSAFVSEVEGLPLLFILFYYTARKYVRHFSGLPILPLLSLVYVATCAPVSTSVNH